jgi:release factor glutamine methyltransferase
MTYNKLYRSFLEQLQAIYNMQEASVITSWVFEKIARVKKMDFIKSPAMEPEINVAEKLDVALQQLLQHTPVQQVLGEAWFYKMLFKVNNQVLIPRPETEELVNWLLDDYKKQATFPASFSILDIGTGSGCIAIALKKNLPAATLTAIDFSEGVLAIAKENALTNNVQIDFIQIDFLHEQLWVTLPCFDIIVSNPPYIPISEKEQLDKNVIAYEPHSALFVPDDTPLLFYEKIALFGRSNLKIGGCMYVEVHEKYANQTADLFERYQYEVEIKKDIFEKDRMLKLTHCR